MSRCPSYVGITCVNGSCPMALCDEFIEYGIPLVHNCDECGYYKGCDDCALSNTEYCPEE